MDDLISRQAAIAYAISGRTREFEGEKWIRVSEVRESLKTLPPAQPRKGKWIVDEKRFGHKEHHCNLCGAILEGDDWRWRNNYYCYHCGAKMEG